MIAAPDSRPCGVMQKRHVASGMRSLRLNEVFTLIEPGPVVLVATFDGERNNVMTISWTTVVDFS